MSPSLNNENWNCPHCGFQHQERPYAIEGNLQCQSCSQWFPARGMASQSQAESPLELLDDKDLFQSLDLTGIDSDPSSEKLTLEGEPPRTGQMVSVRCRVCDTLQYVELKPKAGIKCEVCYAPIPLNPDGTPIRMKGKGQWTAPTHSTTARNVSAEAVGSLGNRTDAAGDEIDELIKDVRSNVEGDFQIPDPVEFEPTSEQTIPLDEPSDELVLQPLEDRSATSPDLLYIPDDVKSELFAQPPAPVEVESDALTPLDDLPEPEPLDAVLDESPPTRHEEPPAFPDDRKVVAQEPMSISFLDASDGPINWDALNLAPLESANVPPKSDPGVTNSPSKPASSTAAKSPPVFSVPPIVDSTTLPNNASKADRSPLGSQPEQPTNSARPTGILNNANVSWDVWRDLWMPFTSPWLIGVAVLLIPLVYWSQLSWRLAIDEGTTFQKLVGYLSVLFSSILVLPVWCALLGVIANRPTSVGQSGRLTAQAIFAQGCQFAMALCCWIPGAALGTITMHYLTIGCGGAVTMLLGGLYLVTTAVVANEMFAGYHPKVRRSFKEQHADWALASIIVGGLLMIGIVLAIATSYSEMLGGAIFTVFVVPASMLYAVTIGCLAKRVLQLDEDEPQGRKW